MRNFAATTDCHNTKVEQVLQAHLPGFVAGVVLTATVDLLARHLLLAMPRSQEWDKIYGSKREYEEEEESLEDDDDDDDL